jgi:two-component system chemotaxis response regulator CheY
MGNTGSTPGSKPWVGKTVVIIDDSKRVRDDLRQTFTACGMQVVGEAADGLAGLKVVQQMKPDIVSLDLIMPEMDGVEAYRRIVAHDAGIKVVMVSWLGGEQKILENLKDLIPGHLFQTKPVSEADLTARLERIFFPHLVKTGIVASKTATEVADDLLDDLGDLGVKVS